MARWGAKPKMLLGLVLVLAVACAAAVITMRGSSSATETELTEYTVKRLDSARSVRQRGILRSADAAPAVVGTKGYILEIVEQGTPVKKGDLIFRIDDSEAKQRIEEYEARIEDEQLALDILKTRYEMVEYQETQDLAVRQAELEHSRLEEKTELGTPTETDLRLLEIERELAELDVADAQADYDRNHRLHTRDFISASALEPYARKLENARSYLEELDIEIQLRKKGISEERRIELRRAVERAQATVERGQRRLGRRLAEVKNQIETSEKKIRESRHHLQHHQGEVANAATYATRDGIAKVRRYRDWRSGGRLKEYKAGVERHPQDIIADVINPEVMKIDLVVNEADFHELSGGMPVRVALPAVPGKSYHGKVEQLGAIGRDRNLVDPTAKSGGNSDIVMFSAEISFDGEGARFQPGMSAMVEVLVEPPAQRLVVHREAVHTDQDGAYVLQRHAGETQRRGIKGRVFNERFFLVEEGLSAGDVILLRPTPSG